MKNVSKFNNADREILIKEIEKIQGVSLSPVKPSRKLFKSNKNLTYLIFGGTGFWHGINKQVVDILRSINDIQKKENVFIIAKKYETQIDRYICWFFAGVCK